MNFDEILNREPETETVINTAPEQVQTFGDEKHGGSFGGGFGGGDYTPPNNDEAPTENRGENLGKKSAMIVGIIDFGVSRLGSRVSGGDANEYKATKTEKRELIEAVQMYLETLPPSSIISAKSALIIAVFMYVGGTLIAAFEEKNNKKKERVKRKQKRDSGEMEDATEANNIRYYDHEKGRGKFKLTPNGTYYFDRHGDYLGNGSEQEPHDDVLALIDEGLTGWEIKRKISASGNEPIKFNQ